MISFLFLLLSTLVSFTSCLSFSNLVDHFSANPHTYLQRYYQSTKYFGGPGSPILCILGGEGALEGLLYPWIVQIVAKELNAVVIEPEHRFYGQSLPFGNNSFSNENLKLLSIPHALADVAYFIQAKRKEFGCSLNPEDSSFCPVITVGGSYPGCLSALMRLRYPAIVQIAYAASAPLLFYTQTVDQYAYYKVITESAERSLTGCPEKVRSALEIIFESGYSIQTIATNLKLCSIPDYILNDPSLFASELIQIVAVQFANLNMENYPPSNSSGLYAACAAVAAADSAVDAIGAILQQITPNAQCFDILSQVPAGANATVACGDFSGCGSGQDGESWDYETCTFEVQAIGTNGVTDMFIPRDFSLNWLSQHCNRFGATPQPRALADLWGLDDLVGAGLSHVIFTNGLNDGWSVAGIQKNLSSTLIAINFPNGAHHSDLSHNLPSSFDTPDITAGRQQALDLLTLWLQEMKV